MGWFSMLRLRARAFLQRQRFEADLNDDLRDYLARLTDAYAAEGLTGPDARRAALRALGGLDQQKEHCREAWGLQAVDDVRRDLRDAVHNLRHAPGFTLAIIATLAVGIGASTAIFSVVDAVLLRPLDFPEPHRLAMVWPSSHSRVSPGYLYDWRRDSQSLEDMAGWQDVRVALTGTGDPVEVQADRVTPNFFRLLGLPAALGRTFTVDDEDLRQVTPEVVLSDGFWRRRYGGDPRVIGQPMTLDGQPFTIIGVMPPGFTIRTVELAQSRAEVWLPMPLVPNNRIGMGGFLQVVARLAPDATMTGAHAELSTIARRIESEHPSYSRDWAVEVVPLLEATVKDVRLSLLMLFAAVGLLVLMSCANVAALVLSRDATRQTELAIRRSLGATRSRLIRQSLTESLAWAAIAGAMGIVLAIWGTTLLGSMIPAGLDLPRASEIGVDPRMLGFAVLVTVFTGLFVGLIPAVTTAQSGPQARLREATGQMSAGPGRRRVGDILVVAQVIIAVLLLGGAGLVGRSVWRLNQVDPGFRPAQVLTVRTTLPADRYGSDDRIRGFSRELLARVQDMPGVVAAGLVNYLPMNRVGEADLFQIQGQSSPWPGEECASVVNVVGGRYFAAMGIPLLRGRLPDGQDTEHTEPVFVIDEALAQRFFMDREPLGTRLAWDRAGKQVSGEIIGVVGTVRWQHLATPSDGTTYFWLPQQPTRQLTLVARTETDPVAMAPLITKQVMAVDPNQPIGETRPMRDLLANDLAKPHFMMLLLGAFAAAALLLAALGLYGVIAFAVAQRTREIGIRVALGAEPRKVLALLMRQGMRLAGIGLILGMIAALVLGRVLEGLLYGIRSSDPLTLLAVSLFLAAIAGFATYLPARRATRVNPLMALRN